MEKSQHSVSGARVRSACVAAKGKGGGAGRFGWEVADDRVDVNVDGVGEGGGVEGGKVAKTLALGDECGNWIRRSRGREWGRRVRR